MNSRSIFQKLRRVTSGEAYLPEIDGLRFLAISMVVLFHINGYFSAKTAIKFTDGAAQHPIIDLLLRNGNRGVELFFVLSGFILCLPFARQYLQQGLQVSLKTYYLRRITRLEPPFIIAITAILIMHLLLHTLPAAALVRSWLASLIYSHNIIYHHRSFLTAVLWSLEIEIQFYLIAPLLFSVFRLRAEWH